MTVYQKILSVMGSVGYLNKDGFVETGKGKGYKALTDEKVLAAVRPALVSAGLVMLPVKMEQKRTDEQVEGYDGKMKTNRVTDVSVTYRIINAENPDDFVEVVSSGTGVDTQDKGIGKAMTYAKKYAILNSFLIPSGDDTDQISSDKYTEQLIGAPEPKEATAPAEAQETPTTGDRSVNIQLCVTLAKRCGRENEVNATGYKGKPWTALSDSAIASLKLWLVSACKGGAA